MFLRRLKRAFAGFLLGGLAGAIIGALGGLLDRGSLVMLAPSGPIFWAIVGVPIGSIIGALCGALMPMSKRDDPPSASRESGGNSPAEQAQGRSGERKQP